MTISAPHRQRTKQSVNSSNNNKYTIVKKKKRIEEKGNNTTTKKNLRLLKSIFQQLLHYQFYPKVGGATITSLTQSHRTKLSTMIIKTEEEANLESRMVMNETTLQQKAKMEGEGGEAAVSLEKEAELLEKGGGVDTVVKEDVKLQILESTHPNLNGSKEGPGTVSKRRRESATNISTQPKLVGALIPNSTSLPQLSNISEIKIENPITKPTPAKSAGIACFKRLPQLGEEEKKHEELDLSNPQDLLLNYLREGGYKANTRKSSALSDFFVEITDEQIKAYSTELVKAIRDRNISLLREFHKEGKTLQCSNRFGESLLHMACRRGYTDVVRFLIKEADVSLRVKDDFGRTPLHDACWSADPNFDLMELIIEHDPDLLLVEDVRGHSPFSYARRSHWKDWSEFLTARRETLRLNTFE